MRSMRSGWRAAHSSATSDPMEWPTSAAFAMPAASSTRTIQSAMAAMLGSGGPCDLPWAGRSTASTLRP
jgi:hypothetical protein